MGLQRLEINLTITAEQAQALGHAATSPEPVAMSVAALTSEGIAVDPRGFVIEEVDDQGWLLVNYRGNEEGQPTWLAADGGWHYGPGEVGYYPWKED